MIDLNTKKVCEVSGVERPLNKIVLTEDNHWVDFDLYKKASIEFRRSLIYLKDIEYVFKDEYSLVVDKFILKIRKYAVGHNLNVEELMQDVMNTLDNVCIVGHNKVFHCLETDDKINLLKDMMEYFKSKGIVGHTNGVKQKKLIKKFRRFTDKVHKEG